MLISQEKWIGPFQIRKLLESCLDEIAIPKPPLARSVYVVTKTGWRSNPTEGSGILYVGGNTKNENRFRTRVGDFLADAFGFYSRGINGHHSGGQRIHEWCRTKRVNPLDLYIAWIEGTECHRCLENRLYQELNPTECERKPNRCEKHS